MRGIRLMVFGVAVAGCATAAATNVRPPLGAQLGPGAKTGTPVPLRFDPTAKVVISTAANLPPASYHAAQATRGKDVFEGSCGTCHETSKFVGQAFVESWGDRRVWDFYSLVRGSMPLDNPGGLKEQEYIDVVAYLLQANHAPAGADSLKLDTASMRGHKIAVRYP